MEKGRRGWKDLSSCRATLFIDFLTKRGEPFTLFAPPGQLQWRIHGRGSGGPVPPYFSTKMRPEGPKKIFWRLPPPYLRVWMAAPMTDPIVHYVYPVRLPGLV